MADQSRVFVPTSYPSLHATSLRYQLPPDPEWLARALVNLETVPDASTARELVSQLNARRVNRRAIKKAMRAAVVTQRRSKSLRGKARKAIRRRGQARRRK